MGSNPVTCSAPDQCHDAGTCDPASGTCSNPAETRRQQRATTATRARRATPAPAAPAAGSPVVCTASDQCHDAGTCDTATGHVLEPAVTERQGVQRRQRLHDERHLQRQRHVRGHRRWCARPPTSATMRARATRPPARARTRRNRTAARATTATPARRSDTCRTAACRAGTPVVCTASDQCHEAGTCDPATGQCSNPA